MKTRLIKRTSAIQLPVAVGLFHWSTEQELLAWQHAVERAFAGARSRRHGRSQAVVWHPVAQLFASGVSSLFKVNDDSNGLVESKHYVHQ